MILLPGLIFILLGKPGRCLEGGGGFSFDGDVRHFAVATNTVYVATDETLYQLSHDLTLVQKRTQRGILTEENETDKRQFYRSPDSDTWNTTFRVNVLLPFDENHTLISCGGIDNGCGYCELLDLADISNMLYRENILVGPLKRNNASVAFLVDAEGSSYILTAIQQNQTKPTTGICPSNAEAAYLHNTNNNQKGGIFSLNADSTIPPFRGKGDLEFVDGFQINSAIYLFSNVHLGAKGSKVRLIWLESQTNKLLTMKSLRGASLQTSDRGDKGSRLLASSLVPGGPPVLWSGVFSVDGGQINTELVLFDISPDLNLKTDDDPDFFSATKSGNGNTVKVGQCIEKKELFHLFALNL